jgi:hypothetical protein
VDKVQLEGNTVAIKNVLSACRIRSLHREATQTSNTNTPVEVGGGQSEGVRAKVETRCHGIEEVGVEDDSVTVVGQSDVSRQALRSKRDLQRLADLRNSLDVIRIVRSRPTNVSRLNVDGRLGADNTAGRPEVLPLVRGWDGQSSRLEGTNQGGLRGTRGAGSCTQCVTNISTRSKPPERSTSFAAVGSTGEAGGNKSRKDEETEHLLLLLYANQEMQQNAKEPHQQGKDDEQEHKEKRAQEQTSDSMALDKGRKDERAKLRTQMWTTKKEKSRLPTKTKEIN